MLPSIRVKSNSGSGFGRPFCQCWNTRSTAYCTQCCACGEENEVSEWKWECPEKPRWSSWVVLSEDKKQVTFHPCYSSGTAAAKGDTPLVLNYHYYWEIKVLSDAYGTDIMIGVGTNKVNLGNHQFKFVSLLGLDDQSYGLSYRGSVRHNSVISQVNTGFCRGSIVGVRLDLWRGTLEFYINRKPQGVSFFDLRRHECLYPLVSSTAAQSSFRLIYAASWRASLLVDAAKILASSVADRDRLPPGLLYTCRSQFWLTLPSYDCNTDSDNEEDMEKVKVTTQLSNFSDELDPNPCMPVYGFYADNVERHNRVAITE